MVRILHLNLKTEYFNKIKRFEKDYEYRLANPYWRQRLIDRNYDEIHIKLGYPKKEDVHKIEIRPWRGVTLETITHELFGPDPLEVYAIRVN